MSVELRELRSFSVLAGELHFRKASDQLFMSQPALSKQIRRLEEKVGGLLFARTRRKVALTEAGKRLLPLAERLLRDADAAMVVARPGASIDPDDLRGHVRELLGSLKTPQVLVVTDELPHTATGKILRREVRAGLAAHR